MPTKVSNVRWKCPQCNKSYWFKPSIANSKKFCSRKCYYKSNIVEKPVREKRANVTVRYGIRNCIQCNNKYDAKTKPQKFCSQKCATDNIHDRRRSTLQPEPRPCEHCQRVFVPRKQSAGRFCSFKCKNEGQKGEKASSWKGGRHVNASGYVAISKPDHPSARGHGGYILEHRYIMEQYLGRKLEKHETIHHINGKKDDNRIENLQLRSGRHGKRAKAVCGECGSHNIVFAQI